MKLMLIDADYNFNKLNEPVIRLYGKILGSKSEGVDAVVHVLGFEPYIILGDCGKDIFELQKQVESVAKGYVKRVEIIKRFKPIGYQIDKIPMLRLVLFSPKVVRELRELLKKSIEEVTDSQFYEADVLFKYRYMINCDLNGMDVIEFSEIGKKIPNYGIGCSELYVCKLEDIKVLKNELVSVEY